MDGPVHLHSGSQKAPEALRVIALTVGRGCATILGFSFEAPKSAFLRQTVKSWRFQSVDNQRLEAASDAVITL